MSKQLFRVLTVAVISTICATVPLHRSCFAATIQEPPPTTPISPVDSLRLSLGLGPASGGGASGQVAAGFHLPLVHSLRWGLQGSLGSYGLFDSYNYRALWPSLALPFGTDKLAFVVAGGVGIANATFVSNSLFDDETTRDKRGNHVIAHLSTDVMYRTGWLVLTGGLGGTYVDGNAALLVQLGVGALLRGRPSGT